VFSVLKFLFTNLFSGYSGTITLSGFLISLVSALLLGAGLALAVTRHASCSRGFTLTLALLPAAVSIVIMMVSGNLGAGVAVAGTFSLVRFRSAPGTAREIGSVFLAMAVGLACGMGYPGFAALFTLIMCGVTLLYIRLGLTAEKGAALRRNLRITIPEDLDYTGIFDDLFAKYAVQSRLTGVKTTNLGSLNRLSYELTLRQAGDEKRLIDELRCRNGNLEISSSAPAWDNREL
jgi:hypothetical protein